MSASENKQRLQHVFSELANGNSQPFVDTLSDSIRWHLIGTTAWSGTFEGKEAVLKKLLGPLRSRIDGRIKVSAKRFIAEDDLVVVEARGQDNVTRDGKPYNNTYCWVYRFENGKVEELTEYFDTELAATTLGRLS